MIHHVFANKSNIGDWLSALGIQALLAPHPVDEHLCDEPFVPETLAKLASAKPDDLIVIGGGGLFMDYFVPFWKGFREIAGRTPFCIWGVGYCDMKREMSRPPENLITEIIHKSQLCSVRDELTRRFLPRCRLPPPSGCPSLSVVEPSREAGSGVLHVDNYDNAGAEVYDFMDACARRFAETTRRPFRKTNNRIVDGRSAELAAVLTRYAASEIVLSSALHGCIIGVAMGKKVIAVSGDHKIESFMEEVGLRDWVCDIREVDTMSQMLVSVLDQPSTLIHAQRLHEANRWVAQTLLQMLT